MRNSSLSLISWCAGQVLGLCVWWFVVCRSLSLIWRARVARVARVVPPAGGLGHCSGCEAFLRCAPCVWEKLWGKWLRWLGELVQSEVVHQEQEQDQVGKPGKGWWVPPSGSQLGGHVQAGPVEEVGTTRWARHARRCCCTPVAGNRWRRWVAAPTCHHLGGTNLPPPCQTLDHGQLMSCASVVTSKGFQAFSMHWRKWLEHPVPLRGIYVEENSETNRRHCDG